MPLDVLLPRPAPPPAAAAALATESRGATIASVTIMQAGPTAQAAAGTCAIALCSALAVLPGCRARVPACLCPVSGAFLSGVLGACVACMELEDDGAAP